MKLINKTLSLLIALAMLAGLAVAAVAEPETYTATAQGFAGDITVWVTVDGEDILEVVAEGTNETPGKGSVAIEKLPALFVESDSADVEGVSGATITSEALKQAVSLALADRTAGEAPEDTEIRFTPGTYTGKGFGFHSYVTVETTFSEDAITAVTVVDNSGETPYLRDLAAEKIPAEIVEQQSLNVDVVTGATWGSTAIIKAVADCVEQAAGADVAAALKAVPTVKPEGEDAVYEGYDLCVVGGGGSDLIAASYAAEAGKKVLVLEAADRLGGVSEIAGGGTLSIGANIQVTYTDENGEEKSYYSDELTVDDVLADFIQQYQDSCNYQENYLIVKRYLEHSGDAVNFLVDDLGIGLTANKPSGVRFPAQGTRYEQVGRKIESLGGTVLMATRGEHLILNEDGSVGGVIAVNQDTGASVTVYARAVLLATGGASNNAELSRELCPNYNEYYMNWGSSTANGDGAQMAWEAGALKTALGSQSHNEGLPLELHDLFDFDITTGNCLYANLAYEPMLRVNRHTGRRISDETIMYTPHYQGNMSMISEGAIVLLDQATLDDLMENGSKTRPWRSKLYADPMKNPDYTGLNLQQQVDEVVEAGYAWKADSIEELAGQLGLSPEILQVEIDKYNAAVATGEDPEFDRAADTLVYTIENGPFYALETRIRNLGTWGGIMTDETLGVYGEDYRLIPGLYASGLDALGWIGTSYFVDTTTLGWMVSSGYMAGESIVNYLDR